MAAAGLLGSIVGDDDGGDHVIDTRPLPVNTGGGHGAGIPSADPLASVASYQHRTNKSTSSGPAGQFYGNGNANGNGHGSDDYVVDKPSQPAGSDGGNGSGEYIAYPSRWAMLAIYACCQIVNSILWITFAPIQPNASAYYGVNATAINMLSVVFMILFFPASILATHVFTRYGLRTALIVASVLNVACGWIRYVCSTHDSAPGVAHAYWLVLFAQVLGGVAQPFTMNAPAKLASEWFPVSQRDLATTVAAMSNPVGIALGQLVPSFFMTDASDQDTRGLSTVLWVEAVVATAMLCVSFLFRAKPPTPPSRSQEQRDQLAAQHAHDLTTPQTAQLRGAESQMLHDAKTLIRNKQFMILNCGFGVGLALFNALTTLIAQLVKPCGYGSNDASYFGAIIIGAGLVGAGVVGPIMDATHAYNRILKVCITLATACSFALFGSLGAPDRFGWVLAAFGVMGCCVMPLLPVAMECGIESTYPVGEESSTGFLMNFGNVPSIVVTFTMGWLLDNQTCSMFNAASITFLVLVVVMWLLILSYNGGYHRLHAEHAKLLPDGHVAGDKSDDF